MIGLNHTALDKYIPEGPITSLRRVQTLYGALAEAANGDVSEFSLYNTPGELEEFTTADPSENKRYLVTVEVDLTPNSITAKNVDVDVNFFSPDDVENLGFACYDKPRGIDHSITRRGAKSESDSAKAADYGFQCLERWTDSDDREPAVGEVAETHPDGWVIQSLQELGQNGAVRERIENQTIGQYTGEKRVVATVKLRLNSSKLEKTSDSGQDWFYPGELHVLNTAMKARKDEKLHSKNTNTPSLGESACMVTGDRSQVYGTAEEPMDYFTIQHAEKFRSLKREDSWRSHPVSLDAALLMQSGSSLVKACRTTRNGLGVYTLPYFVEMTKTKARVLYAALKELQDADDIGDRDPMSYLTEKIEDNGDAETVDSLRFYVISEQNNSGDINVIHEVPDVSLYWPRQIATAHETVLKETFGPVGLDPVENWQPITPQTDAGIVVTSITSGRYAWGTMPKMAGDDGAMADDLAEWLTYSLLTGDVIPVERLLKGYVERIEQAYRDDEEDRLPSNQIKTQFAQLEALARAGLLHSDTTTHLTTPPKPMTQDPPTESEIAGDGDLSHIDVRRHRLESFIENRSSLSQNQDRESAFLLGVLVGMVASHQANTREMNRTVVDQYPPTQITIDRLVRVWPELAEKSDVYAKDVDWTGTSLFPEVLDRQTEDFVHPEEWDLSLQDVRFFYALGLTYGKRADARAYDLKEQIEAREGETSAPEPADVA